MSRTAAQVQAELLALLPDGFAWPEGDVNTYMAARLLPMANEWSLVEQSMEQFEGELDPGTAQYLLPDYLRVLGSPYGWDTLPLSSSQVSALAHQQWVDAPIICAGYFIGVAASIGITISIEEFPRSACGITRCGTQPLTPSPQHCVFKVTLPTVDSWTSRCGAARCGADQISGYTPSVLEPFIRAKAPLFTKPVFSYT